jgi:hypothetical protein
LNISNNSGETLHTSYLALFFNDSPRAQALKKIRVNGDVIWSGTINGSPASGEIVIELPAWETTQVEFQFSNSYSLSGRESLLAEFAENGCASLSVP